MFVAAMMIVCCTASTITAQQQQQGTSPYRIAYALAMSRPQSHLFEVRIEVDAGAATEFVDFQIPRWSPGRYAVFDFAKNVQEVQAVTGICPPNAKCERGPLLPITRVDNQTWRVGTGGSQSVTLNYKVFGNDLSGTFSQLDARHANYNGASMFMYVVGHKPDPVELRITPPTNWRIINGRMERPDQREWQFPNYDVLIDTPTEIAPDWTVDEFRVDGKLYRVMVHSFGQESGKRPMLVRDLEKIVRAETAMWGVPDFESYTFLIHFAADGHSGDGMEHLTSTQVIVPGALGDQGMLEDALDTVAHEFFHVWNVKRLRPVELGPWDFTRPVNTRGLWIAEGLTNYYGHLMMRRAGLWNDQQMLGALGQYITQVENLPGNRLMTAEEASLLAPFIDGSLTAQRTNLANTAISYYWKGETLGLVLDLLIRGRTRGQASLDEVMRQAYQQFYVNSPNASYYLRGRGYTSEDFEGVVVEVAGMAGDRAKTEVRDFFAKHVRRTETLPYDEALAQVGLRLVRSPATSTPYTAGISLDRRNMRSVEIESVRTDSAAEEAGLKQGDALVSIGAEQVTRASWQQTLGRYKQGDRVPVTVRRDGRTVQTAVTLGAADVYTYQVEERKDASSQARALRAAWLNGKRS